MADIQLLELINNLMGVRLPGIEASREEDERVAVRNELYEYVDMIENTEYIPQGENKEESKK